MLRQLTDNAVSSMNKQQRSAALKSLAKMLGCNVEDIDVIPVADSPDTHVLVDSDGSRLLLRGQDGVADHVYMRRSAHTEWNFITSARELQRLLR